MQYIYTLPTYLINNSLVFAIFALVLEILTKRTRTMNSFQISCFGFDSVVYTQNVWKKVTLGAMLYLGTLTIQKFALSFYFTKVFLYLSSSSEYPSFLSSHQGAPYTRVFQTLELFPLISARSSIIEIQEDNIIPQAWLTSVYESVVPIVTDMMHPSVHIVA